MLDCKYAVRLGNGSSKTWKPELELDKVAVTVQPYLKVAEYLCLSWNELVGVSYCLITDAL